MYPVSTYRRVRIAYERNGFSQRELSRKYGYHRKTIKKMLEFSILPGYQRKNPPQKPKLAPFVGFIDAIMESAKDKPKKQRHTAKRIFERIQDEHGYSGGYTTVKDYVREKRLR
jgi:transposase